MSISFHPEFPTWPWPIYIPVDVYYGRASHQSKARGGEKAAILSSPPFLVPNWSGACQSPGTRPWSSFQKGRLEGHGAPAPQGQTKPGLATELKQAVSNKNPFSQPALPLVLRFHQMHRELAPCWEPHYSRSYGDPRRSLSKQTQVWGEPRTHPSLCP